MKHCAVIGLGFGDEGKGSVVDFLCSQNPNSLVVRFNGGHQAAHTVYLKSTYHVFSTFGSGTLRGKPTYWSKYCTVDPISISNEYRFLKMKGIQPKLFIDPDCPVTTPYDVTINIQTDRENGHGSCRVGVSTTFKREEDNCSLKYRDLFYPKILDIKLNLIRKYYKNKNLKEVDSINLDRFLSCIVFMTNNKKLKMEIPKLQTFDTIIWEGAQGILLDQNMGFFPHVTKSNTGTRNIYNLMWESPFTNINNIKLYLVTRAYQTRHGNGPMTNENIPHNIKENPDETNVYNDRQGEFRRTLLDLDLLSYSINSDKGIKNSKNRTLVITCLDQMENEYRFTHKGQIVYCEDEKSFVKRIGRILKIKNILTNHSPWGKTMTKFGGT